MVTLATLMAIELSGLTTSFVEETQAPLVYVNPVRDVASTVHAESEYCIFVIYVEVAVHLLYFA